MNETVQGIFLILHFIGLAALLGGFLTQLREPVKKVTRMMLDGSYLMFISGLVLLGGVEASEEYYSVDHAKFAVKILIIAVIMTLLITNRKKESLEKGTFYAVGVLAITNIIIAVLWANGVVVKPV